MEKRSKNLIQDVKNSTFLYSTIIAKVRTEESRVRTDGLVSSTFSSLERIRKEDEISGQTASAKIMVQKCGFAAIDQIEKFQITATK